VLRDSRGEAAGVELGTDLTDRRLGERGNHLAVAEGDAASVVAGRSVPAEGCRGGAEAS
jgi:hypothetical protein